MLEDCRTSKLAGRLRGRAARQATLTVMFADVSGFTALAEVHGDELANDILDRFVVQVARTAVHTGVDVVKSMGDGYLITSESSERAIAAALELIDRTNELPNYPALHIGLHRGEVTIRNKDVFGRTVNLASRVACEAAPDQILTTAEVVSAGLPDGAQAKSVGLRMLRHVPVPVELFALEGSAACEKAIDPVCHMKVAPYEAVGTRTLAGTTYYFCSSSCERRFVVSPRSYIGRGFSAAPAGA
jgi:adenylate cyclase